MNSFKTTLALVAKLAAMVSFEAYSFFYLARQGQSSSWDSQIAD